MAVIDREDAGAGDADLRVLLKESRESQRRIEIYLEQMRQLLDQIADVVLPRKPPT